MDGLFSLCLVLALFTVVIALLVWAHIRLGRIEERMDRRDPRTPRK